MLDVTQWKGCGGVGHGNDEVMMVKMMMMMMMMMMTTTL